MQFHFTAPLWKHEGPAAWHFISLPQQDAEEIRKFMQWKEEGWGRLKIEATIQSINWKTSIWFDTKHQTYLLPIKAEIRKKLSLKEGIKLEVIVAVS